MLRGNHNVLKTVSLIIKQINLEIFSRWQIATITLETSVNQSALFFQSSIPNIAYRFFVSFFPPVLVFVNIFKFTNQCPLLLTFVQKCKKNGFPFYFNNVMVNLCAHYLLSCSTKMDKRWLAHNMLFNKKRQMGV